jgi:hypothetical protein
MRPAELAMIIAGRLGGTDMNISTTGRSSRSAVVWLVAPALIFWSQLALADDLTGSTRFLCAPVQATVCVEDGECAVDLPWNVNIPQFIEVDIETKRLSTTEASGENRTTPIQHLSRGNGKIVFHGFEMGRAFSWVISEPTGHVTAAVAADGVAVSVFGVCTPLVGDPDPVE